MGFMNEVSSGRITGATRLLIAASPHPLIRGIGDIIVLREGPSQYDAREGFYDLGASRWGIQIILEDATEFVPFDELRSPRTMKLKTQLAEQTFYSLRKLMEDMHTELELDFSKPFTLIAMMQRADKMIRAYVLEKCYMSPIELPPNYIGRGEASATPLEVQFFTGTIYDQLPGKPENVVTFTDFDSWRESLE